MMRRISHGFRAEKTVVARFALALAASFVLATAARAAVPESLQKLESRVQDVAERATLATVCVLNPPGSGSGVIVSEDGYVLTASHVSAGGKEVRLILSDGRQVPAKVLGANRTRDASVLKIEEPGPWPHVPMGRSAPLRQGDWVVALGHPGGYEPGRSPPIRLGRVLVTEDGPFGLITDCTLIGGDSGGPLFNLDGEVVGIHSSIAESTAQNRDVPIDVFHRDWKQMLEGRTWGKLGALVIPPGAGYLGVVAEVEEGHAGLKVVEVEDDKAAAHAGIQAGDYLLAFDGYPLRNSFSLVESVAARMAHDTVKIEIERDGKTRTMEVELSGRPEEEKAAEQPEEESEELSLPMQLEELLKPFQEALPGEKQKGIRIPWDAVLPPRYFSENIRNSGNGSVSKFQKKHASVTGAFLPIARRASLSTVGILGNGKAIALGTIIDRSGDVLTKASELKGDLTIRYPDGQLQDCTVIGVHEPTDLALLRPKSPGTHGGVPISWEDDLPPPGSFVVTPAPDGSIVSVGVISVMPRKPLESRAFLGIATEERDEGVTITTVVPESAAAACGLQPGDVLLKIGDHAIKGVNDVFASIAKHNPGDKVTIEYQRGEEQLSGSATLGTRNMSSARRGRFEQMNQMSGPRSGRRTGFAYILQHDSEVPPVACGGPLVDLRGKAVGINIARSGRVESQAIPAETIQPIVSELQSGKLAPPEDFGQDAAAIEAEKRQIRAQIRRLQRRLRQLEGR